MLCPNRVAFLGLVVAVLVPAADSHAQLRTANGGQAASDTLDAPPPAVDIDSVRLGRDTVVAAPGEVYPAGPVRRMLLGDLNRDLWHLEFPVPVLDLDSVGGGLTVDELSGGKQTLGLRFMGDDGLIYQFRSIVKTASRALPSVLRSTAVEDVAQDQMAIQFPLSAMVVAELVEAAGVLVAKPRPVVMPDDPRLGEYREAFAGRMGWIEVRPDERETEEGFEYAGFAGSAKITGTEELYERLREEPESYVDDRKLLRARLVDMLVGDWDRHSNQWRWASYPDGERTRWEPIPRDRDFAFGRIDGLLPSLAGIYRPSYVGFDANTPDVYDLHWSAQNVDRALLTGLDRSAFIETARELQATFTDDVLDEAIDILPESYQQAVGDDLRHALRVRRDALSQVAEEYYELMSGWVDVYGTEEVDSVALVPAGDAVRVTVWAPRRGDFVRYDRLLHADETKDIRIYLGPGDDRVVIDGPLPIPVRLVSAAGDDRIVDHGNGKNVRVYDDEGDDRFEVGTRAFVTTSEHLRQDSLIEADNWIWETRDWGSDWVPRPEVEFGSDLGLYLGASMTRYGFGFGQDPYHSRFSLTALSGMDPAQWILGMEFDRALGDEGWRTVTAVDSRTDEPVWHFGFGNNVSAPDDKNDFRSFRSRMEANTRLRYQAWSDWLVEVGPQFTWSGPVQQGTPIFDTLDVYGANRFRQAGAVGSFELDTRDSEQYPRAGRKWVLGARVVPSLLDVEDTFGGVSAELREYVSADVVGEPALHLRVRGDKTWGRTPFFELPKIGGSGSLPGFVSRRFVGDAAASATALARVKLLEPTILTDLHLGVHAIGTAGRVWYRDEGANDWHLGSGGGLWIYLPSIDRTVSLSVVVGDTGPRTYLDFGFLF
jgi:hypothetical protein